jgi:hypothetical protein
VSKTADRLRAGRPPKIVGGAMRWSLYVNPARRDAAAARASREGVTLADVLRAYLDAYADGSVDTPQVTR